MIYKICAFICRYYGMRHCNNLICSVMETSAVSVSLTPMIYSGMQTT